MANQAHRCLHTSNIQDETIQIVPRRGLNTEHDFTGLPDNAGRYDLLRLVQDVGFELGFTGGDIQHLHYLVSHTRDVDWEPGSEPIVYKSVCRMARERGVTERQIYNRERKLFILGCLTYSDLENFRRTGYRDESGRIVEAWGVNLAPLGQLYDRLKELKERQKADLAAFGTAKRRLSALRRRILVKLEVARERDIEVEDLIERLAALPRVRAMMALERVLSIISLAALIEDDLERLLEAEKPAEDEQKPALPESPDNSELSVETSDRSEQNFRQLQTTNNLLLSEDNTCNPPVDVDDRKAVAESSPPDIRSIGIEHIPLGLALQAAGDNLVASIYPTGKRLTEADLIDGAARLCHHLGINKSAWANACAVMGRYAAAVAVLIIDRNIHHPATPIKSPGGVLRAMTTRASAGELNLHQSLFGILERDEREGGAL
jgi:replication initiation protein RepC